MVADRERIVMGYSHARGSFCYLRDRLESSFSCSSFSSFFRADGESGTKRADEGKPDDNDDDGDISIRGTFIWREIHCLMAWDVIV